MFIRHHVYLLFEENLRSVLLANRRQVSVPADLDIGSSPPSVVHMHVYNTGLAITVLVPASDLRQSKVRPVEL